MDKQTTLGEYNIKTDSSLGMSAIKGYYYPNLTWQIWPIP